MKSIFDFCVFILQRLGEFTGLGYVNINVIIFCFLLPAFLIVIIMRITNLERKTKAREITLPIVKIVGGVIFMILVFLLI